jgi:hypothetical protein
MMAKNRDERYSNIEELLVDLKAVQAGQTPVRAHKRIDVSVLEQLEDGNPIEAADGVDMQQVVMRYKTVILALGAASVVLLLIIIMLMLRR